MRIPDKHAGISVCLYTAPSKDGLSHGTSRVAHCQYWEMWNYLLGILYALNMEISKGYTM